MLACLPLLLLLLLMRTMLMTMPPTNCSVSVTKATLMRFDTRMARIHCATAPGTVAKAKAAKEATPATRSSAQRVALVTLCKHAPRTVPEQLCFTSQASAAVSCWGSCRTT